MPREIVGRVSSVGNMIVGAAMPVGAVVGGMATDMLNKNAPLMFTICGASMLVCVVLVSSGRDYREYLSTDITDEHSDDSVRDPARNLPET